uniref:MFS transporter n=1 Tax=Tepidiforma sp. TaxID=2682230 RepID=UPI002ADD7B0E
QVYLTFSLGVGLGVGLAYVPAVGAVQRWFVRRRGTASGLAVAGIGAGTLAVPLLAAVSIEALGWRQAYAVVGAAVLLIGLPAARLIEPSPEARGLWPDGDTRPAGSAGPAGGPGVREALRSGPFWLLFGSGLATSLGIFIPFAHLVPFAKDEGHSEAFGTLLIGLIGVGSIGGRLLLGGSADRLGRRRAQAATFTAMGCCLLWWLLVPGAWALVVFALAFGAAYGGFVALSPALAADYFAGRSFGAVLGLIYSAAAIGSLVGPTMAGALFDRTGSYDTPILVAVGLNAVAVGCMVLLREPSGAGAARAAGAPAR